MKSRLPDVSIILPTYNECDSLPRLIPKIHRHLHKNDLHEEIIVVDDHSPDHTAEIAEALSKRYPIRLIRRQGHRSLSRSVLDGINAAKSDICVVMDADGSHPPQTLKRMILPIQSGKVDITVGTRYIAGGRIKGWPLQRRLLSFLGGGLAFFLTPLHDPMSGYCGIRKPILHSVTLNPSSWKWVLELIVKLKNPRFKEIPITFLDRSRGRSKMTLKERWNFLHHLLYLYGYKLGIISHD